MVSRHEVICGWCMTGHHRQCIGKHKHYDVWYECPCTDKAHVGSGEPTAAEATDAGASEQQEQHEPVSDAEETQPVSGRGTDEDGKSITKRPATTRGRPRKKSN